MSDKHQNRETIYIGSCPGCGHTAQLVGDDERLDFVIHLKPDLSCNQRSIHDAWLEAMARIKELEAAQQEAEPVAYCFTDVDGRPVQFCEPPEHASPNDARTRTTLYTAPQPAKPAVPPSEVERRLNRAIRQFRHNDDNSPSLTSPEQGFVIAYDSKEIDQLVALLAAGQGQGKPAVPDEAMRAARRWKEAETNYSIHIRHSDVAAMARALLTVAPQPGEDT